MKTNKKFCITNNKVEKRQTINNPLFRLNPPGHIGCLWFMAQMYKQFVNQQTKVAKKIRGNVKEA
jgi:hypothetical protein